MCHELIVLGGHNRVEKLRRHSSQGPAHPYVKKVRQISVTDVVEVRWIGRNDLREGYSLAHCIGLADNTKWAFAECRKALNLSLEEIVVATRGIAKRIAFCEVPNHW